MNQPGLFAPTQRQLARWGRIRAGGRTRFVLIWGVLVFGIGLYLLSDGLWYLLNPDGNLFNSSQHWLKVEASAFVLHLVGGVLFGLLVWWYSEREYVKHTGNPSIR